MITRKEYLNRIHIHKGIQIREENQTVDKESQDIFESLKIQIILEQLSLIHQKFG